jgi:hypothetical protein
VELHQRGEQHILFVQPIDAKCFGVVALQGREQLLAQLAAGIEGIAQFRLRTLRVRAPEEPQCGVANAGRLRPEDDRQVQLVDHQPLAGHLVAVPLLDFIGEPGSRPPGRIACLTSPDHVGPQGQVGRGDVAQQDIEALVPAVDVIVVRAFEARAGQAQRLHIVARARPGHMLVHMRRQRDHGCGAGFAAQRVLGA